MCRLKKKIILIFQEVVLCLHPLHVPTSSHRLPDWDHFFLTARSFGGGIPVLAEITFSIGQWYSVHVWNYYLEVYESGFQYLINFHSYLTIYSELDKKIEPKKALMFVLIGFHTNSRKNIASRLIGVYPTRIYVIQVFIWRQGVTWNDVREWPKFTGKSPGKRFFFRSRKIVLPSQPQPSK